MNTKIQPIVFFFFFSLCLVPSVHCDDQVPKPVDNAKIVALSKLNWDELLKKFPFKSDRKLANRRYTTVERPDGRNFGVNLTLVAYISTKNVVVVALTCLQIAKEEKGVIKEINYFMLGRPLIIQAVDEAPFGPDRPQQILDAINTEVLLDLFQSNVEDATNLFLEVSAPKPAAP